MASTIPNKEIVRRICMLSGASCCYLRVNTGDEYVEVLTDIQMKQLKVCLQELENWCGMKFRVYSLHEQTVASTKIILEGEKILPLSF